MADPFSLIGLWLHRLSLDMSTSVKLHLMPVLVRPIIEDPCQRIGPSLVKIELQV